MTTERNPVRFITMADEEQQPLGVVAYGGADWTLNCAQCPHSTPGSNPEAAVAELLAHIESSHARPAPVEGSGVVAT